MTGRVSMPLSGDLPASALMLRMRVLYFFLGGPLSVFAHRWTGPQPKLQLGWLPADVFCSVDWSEHVAVQRWTAG